ncbi:MAG: hypothetical protein Q8N59_00235 [bacterium]|nr:hypothetical protein [bacterium]
MNKEMNFLEKSILATIVYYDIFDYPLTGFEVFKYLINPLHVIGQLEDINKTEFEPMNNISFSEILKALEGENMGEIVSQKNGFYFLKGRGWLYQERIERQKIAAERWKKVKKVLRFLQIVPFVQMVAVCNSLAIDNSKKDADIDFFIIARKGRIWFVRFFVTFLVWVIGQWRHKKSISGKICLSFYITDEFLNLRSLAIRPYDIYLASWVHQLRPIYCQEKIYEEFISENQWVKDYLLNFGKIGNSYHLKFKQNKTLVLIRKVSEKILGGWVGDLKEKIFRFFQKNKISRKMVAHDIPTAVVVSDKVLKFHENDKREYFQEEFLKRLQNTLTIDNN